ncbi:Protein binding to mRNAs encoding chromatin modifiers and spindle pole body components; involved in longevity, in maintenance of cell wall integrity, and in sensitivity to and recovery from pheromone arrest, putative [Candida dubliniensis CD36]|uniref:RNA-binding protein, putative n=1 Tax=Candida dubliniensis (strain CD36 / ATCC MYA-646 / CBS 7987 / NCPF 3949 / NRRL Y-17841) TaxID=573826 RepID=B9W9X5_CANDC|nr:Protein binding to mRNAs encoding chromatin modifiers and spindle pole body components; involved in longevity, in maintenance of cell wall integrity, and in sensitivity to and recovery from pheromone arrest, putative [Candida dubliniensis CD36]CAX45613.1 Protein binding to mRNAs encoding chromatin modifiers and spindle pole body components; involved in longevity, in maintenance of cell wall integrity, and in sensitivity to and recovery from pheromone arrest, putative [Candida dubliniensis CD36]
MSFQQQQYLQSNNFYHPPRHSQNLSINSLSSIIEPTTPPNHSSATNGGTFQQQQQQQGDSLQGQSSLLNQQPGLVITPATTATPASTSSATKSSSSLHGRSLSNGATGTFYGNNKLGNVSTGNKSILWDSSNKLNQNLNLPNFSIDNEVLSTPLVVPLAQPQEQQLLPGNNNGTLTSFDDKENMMNKSLISQDFPLASGVGIDKSVVVTNAPKNENEVAAATATAATGSGVSVVGTNSVTRGCTPTSSSSTPSDFAGAVAQQVRFPQKIDKEYLASINKLPLTQLKSEILKLAKDQYGCRFLQKKIDESLVPNYQVRLANFEVIFNQIYSYVYELIVDPFGNYLIQKLIVYCNESNLDLLMEILQYNLFQISINQHGTRALQKIIDSLNNSHQLGLLIKGLKPYIIELIKDLNGNHVIQKILNKYEPPDCQFIYDSIIDDLYIVATHKHGCCVLQKCLNHVTLQQLGEFSRAILKFENFKLLINDQFGNYVLQYLISINSLDINFQIFQNFVNFGISNLCNLKFSSNVVEKFLKNCYANESVNVSFSNLKFELIYIILVSDLNVLINDPYGNYVIQTMIDIMVNPQVNYQNNNIDKLSLVLPDRQDNIIFQSQQKLQIAIIEYWFQNCKIVSSFGKRIQSKINTILNNNVPSSISLNKMHRKSQMNANGEFIVNEFPQPKRQISQPLPLSYRSTSSPAGVGMVMGGTNNVNEYYPKVNLQNRNFSLPTNFYNANANANVNNCNNSGDGNNVNNNVNSNVTTNNNFNVNNNNNNNKNNMNNSVSSFQSGSVSTGPFNNNSNNNNNNSASNSLINVNGNNQGNPSFFGDYAVNKDYLTQQQQQQPQQQSVGVASYADVSHKHQSSISSINLQPAHNTMGHYTTSMAQSYTPPPMQQMPPPGAIPNFYNGVGLPPQMLGHQGPPLPPPPPSLPQQQQQSYQQRQQHQQQQNIAQPIYNNHSHNLSWSSVSSFGGGKTIYGSSNNW